jgi:hypothetical protein
VDKFLKAWGRAINAKLQEQADAESAEILAVMLNPPPERIVRSSTMRPGRAYEIPAESFSDGLARLIVAPGQHLAESVLEQYR